jgi:hypothetical protein
MADLIKSRKEGESLIFWLFLRVVMRAIDKELERKVFSL